MKKTILIFLTFFMILSWSKTDNAGSGFYYYPEDTTYPENFFLKPGAILMKSFYPSDTTNKLIDYRNGFLVYPDPLVKKKLTLRSRLH